MQPFNTPILFIIFNRPDTTVRVFEEIRKIRPNRLFIAADGPRMNKPEDVELCRRVREIVTKVDWPCEVKTLFKDKNLGCKIGVTSAIDWFFSIVNEGIIFEDDCLPHPSFFPYCQELLERYRSDGRIMMISGLNVNVAWPSDASYLYSKYSGSWGWATWKRAWKHYDEKMVSWAKPEVRKKVRDNVGDRRQWKTKKWIFDSMHAGKRDSVWDYAWEFAMLSNSGLCVVPRCNLIENIGFGADATHTRSQESPLALPRKEIVFPLVHNENVETDNRYDAYFMKKVFGEGSRLRSLFARVQRKIEPFITACKDWRTRLSLWRLARIARFTETTVHAFGHSLHVADSASFLSAYREIVSREIYAFASGTPSPYILDCGANVGVSVLWLKKKFPAAEIVAFEPDPEIYDILKKNVDTIGSDGITLVNKALWDKETELSFFAQGADGGRIDTDERGMKNVKVKTMSLRHYMERPVDFLKIDIEGAEDVVIRDIEPLLGNVRNLFVEYHSKARLSQTLHEILTILTRAGFRYYIESSGVRSNRPFISVRSNSLGLDNQMNIFAYRN